MTAALREKVEQENRGTVDDIGTPNLDRPFSGCPGGARFAERESNL
jgi:hypothetical protein